MKKLIVACSLSLLLAIVLLPLSGWAQQSGTGRPSPAATASGKIGSTDITIRYSSPSVKERKIWGELVPYGQVWRAGANEATTFEASKEVQVEGKKLPAGKYALFAIPSEKEWTIIFNKVPEQWGAFKYNQEQDALRVTVMPKKSPSFNERLVYDVTKNGIVLKWENLEVPVTIH